MKVRRFIKKPIVVEAVLWSGENVAEMTAFLGNTDIAFQRESLFIVTPEGVMEASKGDWVIKGVEGEFYPCKASVFDVSYEPTSSKAAHGSPDAWPQP